ncbi:MAG: DUF2306 domain-containing protein [Pseudomonadota bacterium]
MRSISRREWILLAFILIYSFIPTFGGLFRVAELLGGQAILPANARALAYPLPIVVHVLSSFLFCILGALQFLPSVRRYHLDLHRIMGRVLVVASFVSAATGLWMTHVFVFPEDLQGALLYWVRIVLSLAMCGLIVRAVISIRSRKVPAHGSAMVRAYAIAQGASTQAFLGIGWIVAVGTEPQGPLRDVIMVAAWGINLVAAEYLISKIFSPRTRPI